VVATVVPAAVRRPDLGALTGVRFLAAFWVLLAHAGAAFSERSGLPAPLSTFLYHGTMGVFVFFTLSGFILFYNYQGRVNTRADFYPFLAARIARLYPVYLLALVAWGFVLLRLPEPHELLVIPMLQSWVPAGSPGGYSWLPPAWSLSVEFFFYLCFPLLLLAFRRERRRSTLWCAAAALLIAIVALRTPVAHPDLDTGRFERVVLLPVLALPDFLLGMVLGALFLSRKRTDPQSVSSDWTTLAAIVPCFCILTATKNLFAVSFAVAFASACGIYRLADGKGILTGLLRSRTGVLLGGASYSVYLLQAPIREFCRRFLGPVHAGLDAAVSPPLIIAISCLVFLFYEQPMRVFLRGLLNRRKRAVS